MGPSHPKKPKDSNFNSIFRNTGESVINSKTSRETKPPLKDRPSTPASKQRPTAEHKPHAKAKKYQPSLGGISEKHEDNDNDALTQFVNQTEKTKFGKK